MIYVDSREEKIVVMTRGGVATRADQNAQHDQPHVRPKAQKKILFEVQREKEVFLDL